MRKQIPLFFSTQTNYFPLRAHLYPGSPFPRAHAHASLNFFDHRPPFPHIIRLFNDLQRWSILKKHGFRPPFDHPPNTMPNLLLQPQTLRNHNRVQYRLCIFKCSTTPLSYIRQHYCTIFDITLFSYLKQLVSNIEKALV